MMGGGVCWLDYNGDGWQDLFAVNSYASNDTARWQAHGGLPRTQLFENRARPVPQRHREGPRRAAGAGRRVRRGRSERGRPARPDRVHDERDQAAVEQRQRHVQRGRPGGGDDCVRLVHRRRRRGRERRRPPGRLRRRLHTSVRSGAELPRRLPDQPRRSPRPALPERGERPERPRPTSARSGSRRGSRRPTSRTVSARRSSTSTATVGPTSTSRTTRIRTSSTSTSRGRAAPRPTRPGSASASRTAPRSREWPTRTPAWASRSTAPPAVRSTSSSPTRATSRRPRSTGTAASTFSNARPDFDPALGADFAGWGDSFVDLRNSGRSDLVLATGGIPVTNLKKDAGEVKVIAPLSGKAATRYGVASGLVPSGLRVNGRGARGGRRRQRRTHGDRGQLDRRQARPALADRPGRSLARGEALPLHPGGGRDRHPCERPDGLAGGSGRRSYLSSEDQRVHFGLGTATRVARLTVRYPWGGQSVLRNVRADRIVEVRVPRQPSSGTDRAQPRPTVCRPARRRPTAARSRRSGTRRRSPRSAPAPRVSPSRRATSSTSPGRCGTRGQPRRRLPPPATQRSATRRTACCSGRRPSTRT